jgi:DNA polymerase delta subunit 3
MLFDFHRTENAKQPQSVSATYLICGVQASEKKSTENGVSNEEDVPMKSSPFMSSMPQPDETEQSVPVTTFVLAREEDLEGIPPRMSWLAEYNNDMNHRRES